MTDYNFLRNENKDPDIEMINIIKSFMLSPTIEENDISILNNFFDTYFRVFNEYINSQSPSLELIQRLQLLTSPINDAFTYSNAGKNSPAIKIILDNIDSQGKKIEKEFNNFKPSKPKTLTLKQNTNAHAISEEYIMNAFWQAPLIIAIAGIIGIILSCILYFYK